MTWTDQELLADRCQDCRTEHDQALAAGRWPPPVKTTVPGTATCTSHAGTTRRSSKR